MDNNYTVLAAYVTALAAIIAPTITALINSLKEYKISKFTSTIQERLKLCKQFSESYAKCQYGDQRVEFMKAFYKHSMELIALCHHRSTRRALFHLANVVLQKGASKYTDSLYEHCIQLLSREF